MGALVELIMALVVMTIATVTVVKAEAEHSRTLVLEAEGQHIALLNQALAKYQSDHSTALVAGQPVTGFANPLAPTVAELANARYLAVNQYRTGPFWGGEYRMKVIEGTSPPGCTVVDGGSPDCMPVSQTMVWTTKPLMRVRYGQLAADVEGAGQVVAAGGADLGMSTVQQPATIAGDHGRFKVANPMGSAPAILAAVSGAGTDPDAIYYRRDGSLPLTGPLAGGGQDIRNVKNVYVSNNVETTNLKTTGDNYLMGTAMPGSGCGGLGGSVRRNGETGAGLVVCDGAVWQPVGTAVSNVTAGTWCPTPGRTATNAQNVTFICNNRNVYVPLANALSNFVVLAEQMVRDGDRVAKPVCGAGGAPDIHLIPQSMGTNLVVSPPFETSLVRPADLGNVWGVTITMQQANTGGSQSGNALNLSALAVTGCSYAN
ncbi:hypothetical protein [Burkholderia cepacia]|uniref:hypothetical protein n=1 Tax=Burkholderia cepacia TaxID=292 RepID=UPI002ABD7719|nr:hypothetical protein [Burkholderia cepacia]